MNSKKKMNVQRRCSNFTKDEVEVLMGLVEKHKEVVECKKTDAITCGAKEVVWNQIELKFNGVCGTGRTAKMLRSKWESLKKTVKKEYAEQKQQFYKTGVEVKLSSVGYRVLALIGAGATGTISVHDSDFDNGSTTSMSTANDLLTPLSFDNQANMEEKVELHATELIDNSHINDSDMVVELTEMPSCSWNPWTSLERRKSKCRSLQPISSETTENDVEQLKLFKTKIRDPLDNTATSQTSKSMKRKRFYKAESTGTKFKKRRSESTLEEVARKKIEFIDFQMDLLKQEAEMREKRLAEKHELEIKILEKELNK